MQRGKLYRVSIVLESIETEGDEIVPHTDRTLGRVDIPNPTEEHGRAEALFNRVVDLCERSL